MITTAIFDLDGTLLDTLETITYYVNETLHAYALPPITKDECRYFVGDGARNLISRALVSKGITDPSKTEAILAAYSAAYDAAPLYLTAPYPGILDMLSTLHARGISVSVLSNKPESATVPIVRHFFGNLVGIVHGGREGVPLKPDPTSCLDILTEIDKRPDETLYVGDTNTDIMTGKNLGAAKTIGVSWGFRPRRELLDAGADAIVDAPIELLSLIEQ